MSDPRSARILIVDDSAVMRSLLRSVVHTDKTLEVVGTAADGASALQVLDATHPDLILLDVEMPGMDGLSTLKQIKARGCRIPVIMCSSLTQRGARVTIDALASGAADYVAKPSGQASREAAIQTLAHDLIPKILAFTANSQHSSAPPPASKTLMGATGFAPSRPPLTASSSVVPAYAPYAPMLPPPSPLASVSSPMPTLPSVIVLGVSTGGPAALDELLPALPETLPVPLLIVQHMPELFTKLLAERLNSRCSLRVVEAVSGEPIRAGSAYIARGDWHMALACADRSGLTSNAHPLVVLRLNQDPVENHCRPSVDVLFRSAVSLYANKVLGIILTGMGSDGLAGCRLIRQQNGGVIAQDQATSAVWGMPGAVTLAGLAHRVLPLHAIATEILRLTSRGQREASELRESVMHPS